MIQVTYFKKTGGKRFFKMAPIHHHFELCGWSETRVVAVFTVVTALLCLLGTRSGIINRYQGGVLSHSKTSWLQVFNSDSIV